MIILATKLAAHEDRGVADPLTSEDLEDVVALLANRPELPDEILESTRALREWIANRLRRFLPPGDRRELVASFLPETRVVPELLEHVLDRLKRVIPDDDSGSPASSQDTTRS